MSNTNNKEVRRATVKLPSNGRVGSGIKEVEIKSMRVNEVANLQVSNNVINTVVSDCILSDIDIKDLTVQDKIFLCIQIYILTFGPLYGVRLICSNPTCGKSFDYDIDLSKLEIKELGDDFINEVKVTLPVSKDIIVLSIPTSKDIDEFDNFIRKYSETTKTPLNKLNYINQVMIGIESVNGENLIDQRLYEYLLDMDPQDFEVIQEEILKLFDFGCDLLVTGIKCPHCESLSSYLLRIDKYFFRRKR